MIQQRLGTFPFSVGPVRAGLLAAALCAPVGAWAQRVGKPAAEPAPATMEASFGRSALRATTFKAGTTVLNLSVLTFALGSATDALILSLGLGASAWTIYTVNGYLWDYFDPPPAPLPGQPYDAEASAIRTTKKFATVKPIAVADKYLWIYFYTGSAATSATWGTVTAVVNLGYYYPNEMVWDWYDWTTYAAEPQR